ncbi:MAG: hypothetical protein WC983_03115 [Tissierellaceae bacterium]
MKRQFIISLIFIAIIFLSNGLAVNAGPLEETPKVYSFAANRNFPPFEYLKEDGEFTGF